MSDSIEVNPGAASSALGTIAKGGGQYVDGQSQFADAIRKLDGSATGSVKEAAVELNQMLQNFGRNFEETRAQMVTTAQQQVDNHLSIDSSRGGQVRSI